jgi:hypothetical protein
MEETVIVPVEFCGCATLKKDPYLKEYDRDSIWTYVD